MMNNSNPELLASHFSPFDPILNLLERNVSRKVRAPTMLRLRIDTERTEPAIIRRTQLVDGNILARLHQRVRDLLHALRFFGARRKGGSSRPWIVVYRLYRVR